VHVCLAHWRQGRVRGAGRKGVGEITFWRKVLSNVKNGSPHQICSTNHFIRV
jgi:hypothetical protein